MSRAIQIRLRDGDEENLEKLVVAVRAFYSQQSVPAFKRLGDEVTRSSALRDLLAAWARGEDVSEMFVPTPSDK